MEKLRLDQIRIRGARIACLPKGTRYGTSYLGPNQFENLCESQTNLVSYGHTLRHKEECIRMENIYYTGENFYEVPVSELIRLGIVHPKDPELDDALTFRGPYPQCDLTQCKDEEFAPRINMERYKQYNLIKCQKPFRQIIKYKLAKLENKKAYLAIMGAPTELWFTPDSYIHEKAIETEIMHWFEPEYEAEPIMIGDHQVRFNEIARDVFRYDTVIDGVGYTKEFWEAAKVISKHEKAEVIILSQYDCQVSTETIEKILKEIK